MATSKPKPPPTLLLKPTLKTKFHIDYGWWERNSADLRAYMVTHLPAEVREHFASENEDRVVDYVDPQTGEVFQLDSLGIAIQQAASEEDFINLQTPLVDSVFRVFLANGNVPKTPEELAEITGRDANTILKTLGGVRVYKGIRPFEAAEQE